MKVLGLDISSQTGWCVMEDGNLLQYGCLPYEIQSNEFPWGILKSAEEISDLIINKIQNTTCDKIIVERTVLGRARDSQALLESIHTLFQKKIKELDLDQKIHYIDVSLWRKKINLKLSKEDKENNKFINKAKEKVVKKNGKRIGKIGKKHVSVRYANEKFGLNLKLKNNNEADAINLASAFFI